MLNVLRNRKFVRPKHRPVVDVVIAAGHIGPNGQPINTDKLFIMRPVCTETVSRGGQKGGKRVFAPGFDRWNKTGGIPQVTGFIHHERIEDAISDGMAMAKPPKRGGDAPPGQQPWCSSDGGGTRKRWVNGEWETGTCGMEACPFYAEKKCKAHVEATFTLKVEGYPTVDAFWQTHGIGTMRNISTWLHDIEAEWQSVLRANKAPTMPMWFQGLPIRMQVSKVSRKHGDQWRKYPEIQIKHAIPISEWFDSVVTKMETMGGRLRALAALPDIKPTAGQLQESIGREGDTLLSGGKLLSAAPRVLVVEAPDLDEGVPTDPDGMPLCSKCDGQMRQVSAGYDCLTNGCLGVRDDTGSESC